MHSSSFAKMASFFRAYGDRFPRSEGKPRVLDVGSKTYKGQKSYRDILDDSYGYSGLDLEPGDNVDIVASSGFVWPEIADRSFDVITSGQTFEHNPFFWATMAEISRVLVPGGFTCIIAPASQPVHRYPLDCWRFYPDAWAPLCALVGLQPVEVFVEPDDLALSVIGGENRDSMLIARRPNSRSTEIEERLKVLTEPFRRGPIEFDPVMHLEGPCIADYRNSVPRTPKLRARLAFAFYNGGPAAVYDPNSSDLS
jgi:SAM-dependent methyltransferase